MYAYYFYTHILFLNFKCKKYLKSIKLYEKSGIKRFDRKGQKKALLIQ